MEIDFERAGDARERLFPPGSSAYYGLVNVLYSALNRDWRYEAYTKQANEVGDEALAAFFREIQQEEWGCAERARELLRKRIGLIWDS
jgi:hypothetical protein